MTSANQAADEQAASPITRRMVPSKGSQEQQLGRDTQFRGLAGDQGPGIKAKPSGWPRPSHTVHAFMP
jgi:hypothetical protein